MKNPIEKDSPSRGTWPGHPSPWSSAWNISHSAPFLFVWPLTVSVSPIGNVSIKEGKTNYFHFCRNPRNCVSIPALSSRRCSLLSPHFLQFPAFLAWTDTIYQGLMWDPELRNIDGSKLRSKQRDKDKEYQLNGISKINERYLHKKIHARAFCNIFGNE